MCTCLHTYAHIFSGAPETPILCVRAEEKEELEKDSEGEGVCWHAVYTVTSSPV